jgi:tryptophan halogenase
MDYGWMWQIPLQHRYGAGYVFDSDFISEDDAKKEIDSLVGFEVESPRTFCFDAGNYKDIWINNCLAIGLSSGFLEPLEATSIWQAILNLEKFFSNPYNLFSRDKKLKELYNKRFVEETQAIVDFLYLHYITDKDNTEFWKNFTRNNKMPEKIKYLMEINNSRIINFKDFDQTILFLYFDYIKVMDGNNILNDSIDKQFYLGKEQEIISRLFSLKNIQDSCVTQKDFIEMIKRNHHEKQ